MRDEADARRCVDLDNALASGQVRLRDVAETQYSLILNGKLDTRIFDKFFRLEHQHFEDRRHPRVLRQVMGRVLPRPQDQRRPSVLCSSNKTLKEGFSNVAFAETPSADVGRLVGSCEGGAALAKAFNGSTASWNPTLRTAIQRSVARLCVYQRPKAQARG